MTSYQISNIVREIINRAEYSAKNIEESSEDGIYLSVEYFMNEFQGKLLDLIETFSDSQQREIYDNLSKVAKEEITKAYKKIDYGKAEERNNQERG